MPSRIAYSLIAPSQRARSRKNVNENAANFSIGTQVNNSLSVKRLRRCADHKLMISGDNPIYGSEEVAIDAIRIVGRVIWAGGKV